MLTTRLPKRSAGGGAVASVAGRRPRRAANNDNEERPLTQHELAEVRAFEAKLEADEDLADPHLYGGCFRVTTADDNDANTHVKLDVAHKRLGHVAPRRVVQAVSQGQGMRIIGPAGRAAQKDARGCHECLMAKATAAPHRTVSEHKRTRRYRQPGAHHSADTAGPLPASLAGMMYALVATDLLTGEAAVYGMKRKSETPAKLDEYLSQPHVRDGIAAANDKATRTSSRTGRASIRTDGDAVYTSKEMSTMAHRHGVEVERSPPYTPQANGQSERLIRTLFQIVRCLLATARLGTMFWFAALQQAAFIHNVLKGVYEDDNDLNRLRVWGCLVYCRRPSARRGTAAKLHASAQPMIYLGYSRKHHAHRSYCPWTKRYAYSNDVCFVEDCPAGIAFWDDDGNLRSAVPSSLPRPTKSDWVKREQYKDLDVVETTIDEVHDGAGRDDKGALGELDAALNDTSATDNAPSTDVDAKGGDDDDAVDADDTARDSDDAEDAEGAAHDDDDADGAATDDDANDADAAADKGDASSKPSPDQRDERKRLLGAVKDEQRGLRAKYVALLAEEERLEQSLLMTPSDAKTLAGRDYVVDQRTDLEAAHPWLQDVYAETIAQRARKRQRRRKRPADVALTKGEEPAVEDRNSFAAKLRAAGVDESVLAAVDTISEHRAAVLAARANAPLDVAADDAGTPATLREALLGPDADNWQRALAREWERLQANGMFELVPREQVPHNATRLRARAVLKRKIDLLNKGKGSEFKVRLAADGSRQDVAPEESYSPTLAAMSVRVFLIIALQLGYYLSSLDFTQAYAQVPYPETDEPVYLIPPPELVAIIGTGHLLKVRKMIYGLRRSGRCFHDTSTENLRKQGYTQLWCDPCLWIKRLEDNTLSLAGTFVDDWAVAAARQAYNDRFQAAVAEQFLITYQPVMQHFIGLDINYRRTEGVLTIGNDRYVDNMLKAHGIERVKPKDGHVPIRERLHGKDAHEVAVDERKFDSGYARAVGKLVYLCYSYRPDVCYATNQLCRRLQNPSADDKRALNDVYRYVARTRHKRLVYRRAPAIPQPDGTVQAPPFSLTCWVDADHLGDTTSRKSTAGHFLMLNGNCVEWVSKVLPLITLSSTESEICAASRACQSVVAMQHMLEELSFRDVKAVIKEDNAACIAIAQRNAASSRTRHLHARHLYVCQCVAEGRVTIEYVPTNEQYADAMTKPATKQLMQDILRNVMGNM